MSRRKKQQPVSHEDSTAQWHGAPERFETPPKKKHTVRNVFLGVSLVALLGFGGCALMVGSAVNEVDKAVQAEAANDKPTTVKEGAGFEHDIWAVNPDWKVGPSPLGATIRNLEAENVSDTADLAGLSFQLLDGKRVVASIDCTSNKAQPGQVIKLDCIPDGKARGWDKITVADLL